MAVVTRYTKGYPQVTPAAGFGYQNNAWHEAQGNVRVAAFNIAATNADSIGSVYKIARVPSNAILLPQSNLYAPAIAGATSVSLGLNDRGGNKSAAALMSAVNISAGGTFAMLSAVGVANYLKRVWDLLGLANEPNAMIDIELTLNAALTASGALTGFLLYDVIV